MPASHLGDCLGMIAALLGAKLRALGGRAAVVSARSPGAQVQPPGAVFVGHRRQLTRVAPQQQTRQAGRQQVVMLDGVPDRGIARG